jgi:hypothetical protein
LILNDSRASGGKVLEFEGWRDAAASRIRPERILDPRKAEVWAYEVEDEV